MFRLTYRAETIIDAPRKRVWDALVGFEDYPDWNPFTVAAGGRLETGAPVQLQVLLRGKVRAQTETIRRIDRGARIDWGFGILGGIIVRGERRQSLEDVDGGRTRYVTEDTITGLMAPIVRLLYDADLTIGFEGVARGLKDWVEQSS